MLENVYSWAQVWLQPGESAALQAESDDHAT